MKILVIDAHPYSESLCHALSDAYISGAKEANHEVQTLVLRDLKFDPLLRKGYREIQKLEPDLIDAQEKIKQCEHLVFVYPIWWGTMPALMKGFLDRCWLPGFAFQYHTKDPFWDKLLRGRSARMIVTSDAPYFFNFIAYFNAPYQVMKKTVLKFCGFNPVRVTAIGRVKNLKSNERTKVIESIRKLGTRGN